MLQVYALETTLRLRYVLDWVLIERLGIEYAFCENSKDAQLVYGADEIDEQKLRVFPQGILSQTNIQEQPLSINRWRQTTTLFYNQPRGEINFDIFGAIFFLISRYEEYLTLGRDKHDRFPAAASIAAKFSFLQKPVVDVWTLELGKLIERKFGLQCKSEKFELQHTYDNDLSWKYLHKSPWKQRLGAVRDAVLLRREFTERRRVFSGKQQDPFQCFDKIAELHQQHNMPLQIFVLSGGKTAFEANTPLENPAMAEWLKSLSKVAELSLHPSYDPAGLTSEHAHLSKLLGKLITSSRQHYIRLAIPQTYRNLIAVGITNDYTMGYPDANGFRAGTSQSFPWYDLEKSETTRLRIHPFCFMDATSIFYNKHSIKDAAAEWQRLRYGLEKVNGKMICIWHNYIIGDGLRYAGWWALYAKTFSDNNLINQ